MPSHVVGSVPPAPPDPDPLVREIAQSLYSIQCNYEREGTGPGSRFEGETLEQVQARCVVRRVREHGQSRHQADSRTGVSAPMPYRADTLSEASDTPPDTPADTS